jgi:hypothetical protein
MPTMLKKYTPTVRYVPKHQLGAILYSSSASQGFCHSLHEALEQRFFRGKEGLGHPMIGLHLGRLVLSLPCCRPWVLLAVQAV